MTDNESHDTTVVPTIAAAAHVSALAWSDDDEPDTERQSWRSAWGIVAVIAACSAVLAGTAGVVLWVTRSHDVTPAQVPTSVVVPSVSVALPPLAPTPTVTQTVTAAPPPLLSPQDRDARFTALMATQHLSPEMMTNMTDEAGLLCLGIAKGKTTKSKELSDLLHGGYNITAEQATFFVNTAVEVYCPTFN